MTVMTAHRLKRLIQEAADERNIKTQTTKAKSPTREAAIRWVCSYLIPPTIWSKGKANMNRPYVVGQSGTDSPDSVLLTKPPRKIRKRVEALKSFVKRLKSVVETINF